MKKEVLNKLIAKPYEKHKVSDFKSDFVANLTQEQAEKLLRENIVKMKKLQDKLYASDRRSVLIIFQAMDAAGKDGTIKHVMSGVNPQGCQVHSFKQPSPEELNHSFLWRINKALPQKGMMGIFNRSHYEDVLVVKVHPSILLNNKLPKIKKLEDITDKFWKRRYAQINDFEEYLTDSGTVVLKFFLNVSKEEQKNRFMARLDDESKNWKFSASDLKERAYWNDYMKVYSDMLTNTSTNIAPWHVIPADNKWFMRYAVSQIICDTLQGLKLEYPVLSEQDKANLEIAKQSLLEEDNSINTDKPKKKKQNPSNNK